MTDSLSAALAGIIADLPDGQPFAAPVAVAARFAGAERHVDSRPLGELGAGDVAAALLVEDEISLHGDRAEELISLAADAIRPAGTLVLTALVGDDAHTGPRGVRAATVSPALRQTDRTFDADDIEHLLMHRGLSVQRLERHTGDDGRERFLAAARTPVSSHERSVRFIASLPFKLVTAAVVCLDADDRLLCVFDSFRRHWTIPGGVVDAGEDPRAGAMREGVEESGVRVQAGPLLGVFSTAVPDRLLMIYAATPLLPADPTTLQPLTRQPHEVGEVRWVPVAEALELLNRRTRWQVEQCLDHPGETWRE